MSALAIVITAVQPVGASWPFADPSALPLLRDDVVPGGGSVSYRITASAGAEIALETAHRVQGNWADGDLIALWPVGHKNQATMLVGTGTAGDLARIRVVSNPLGIAVDTEPSSGLAGTFAVAYLLSLPAGTYDVVMASGGSHSTIESLFRLHGDDRVTFDAVNFGGVFVAGPDDFAGLANVLVAGTQAIAGGTVHSHSSDALTGYFNLGDAGVGSYRAPNGNHVLTSSALFVAAAKGAYDFTLLASLTATALFFPPGLVLADVTPA